MSDAPAVDENDDRRRSLSDCEYAMLLAERSGPMALPMTLAVSVPPVPTSCEMMELA